MKPIFKPASFGKKEAVVKFNTNFNKSENNAVNSPSKKKKKVLGNKSSEKMKSPKILSGRIEKKKKIKPKITQQQVEGLRPDAQAKKKKAAANINSDSTTQQSKKKNKKEKSVQLMEKFKKGRIDKKKQKQAEKKQQEASGKKINLKSSLLHYAVTDVRRPPVTSSDIDSLTDQLKQSLKGGRFRYINEQLYTMDSEAAQRLFAAEPDSFDAYHEGYRSQVEKWPMNPLARIIKKIRRLPKTHVIGDFGCGEGRLAESVPNKVYSMDLVSCRDDIIACDMAKTPLPDQSIDVAVYCLSLMGTNLHDYLLEANRVLKDGGTMFIAEIQSRFEGDVRPFLRALQAAGFHLVKREEGSKIFFFFQMKKTQYVGDVASLPALALKPCVYKKR